MPQTDPVVLRLLAENREYFAKLNQAVRFSDEKLSAIERRADKMASGLQRSFSFAGKAALGYVATLATIDTAKMLAGLVDSSKSIEAQLKLATRESGSFAQAQEDVRRVSMTTRSELESTAQLYGNFQRNARELGISQEEAARATESVSKAFKVSGAATVETAQGVRQLVQALQSGVLRGDEFNTIMEAAPRLSKLFADSLGVTQGELRKLAEDGKLTSASLVKALTDTKFTASLDAEFKELPVTFSDAMTQIENAAIITFGAFDRGGRFSEALVSFFLTGTTGFSDMEGAAEEAGIKIRAEIEGLATAFEPLMDAAARFFGYMSSQDMSKYFSFEQDAKDIDAFTGWLSRQGIGGGLLTGNNDWLGNPTANRPWFGPSGTNMTADYRKGRDASLRTSRQKQYQRGGWFQDMESWRGSGWWSGGASGPAGGGADSGGGGGRKARGPSAETLAKRAESERIKAIRDDESDQREWDRLDDDILAARAALATAAEDLLEFQMEAIRRAADQEVRGIEVNGKINKTDAEIIAAKVASVRQHEDLLKLGAQRVSDEARAAEKASKEDSADQAIEAGKSPGQRYLSDLRNEAEHLGDAYEDIAVNGLERMGQAFTDNITKALGLHGVLGDIIGDFIELAYRQAVLQPLANALFGGSGGGGGLLGQIFGAVAGTASGGKVLGAKKIPGFAGGTNNAPRGLAWVGEEGRELVRFNGGEQVIPNHELTGARGGAGGTTTVRLELSGDLDARITNRSAEVSVQVVKAAMPSMIDASARETLARSRRPGL